ncbi:MAG: translation elongation factor Ts, partial [Dysgonamonadaceae bacterium]|nr:translation elongation factor Ts [Dysgonamonadaceae bacterium]
MAVTMADIQHLRKMTGAGMMDCKNALNSTNGDFDKAVEIIRKKGQAVAAKREDREASEGCVLAKTENGYAAVVALQCETDFVAKNSEFIALTEQILDVAMEKKPKDLEELLSLPLADGTVLELITDRIGATGEKMELGYYEHITAPSVVAYIHPGNKLATIIGFNKESVDGNVAKDIAMQVAAMNPIAITSDEIPDKLKESEMKIAREKALEGGKPEHILDRIAEGALQKFFKESTLLLQDYV